VSSIAESAELREIRGPSAFGGGWQRTWRLLWLISVTEFRVRYTNTFLGYAWSVLRPFIFFGIIYTVVNQVLRYGDAIPNFAAMLVVNLALFQYFQEATSQAVRSITSKEALVRKMQFPRIVIPLSVNLTAAISLFFNLIGVFLLLLVVGIDPRWTWLLLPLVIVVLVTLTTALSMFLAVAYVRSRDVAQAWTLFLRGLFYATPILYAIDIVPDSIAPLIAANPLTPLLSQVRIWVLDPAAPTTVEVAGSLLGLWVPLAIGLTIVVAGLWLFNRDAPRVAEAL
jgi:ABC-2 type transport system permease protein